MAGRGTAGRRRELCRPLRLQLGLAVVSMLLAAAAPFADDWPEFRGAGRRGVWNETGILDRFPEGGLKVLWRAPVKAGYSGPVVAGGRVFVTDFVPIQGARGTERILCFDERTGTLLWKQEWEASYGPFVNTNGPHATPTVDGDRVYALGTAGTLLAMNAVTGEVLWRKDFVKDLHAELGIYGFSSAPIVDGGLKPSWTKYTAQGQTTVWQAAMSGFASINATHPVLGVYVNNGTVERGLDSNTVNTGTLRPGESTVVFQPVLQFEVPTSPLSARSTLGWPSTTSSVSR